jgi:hypothetical protein
MNKILNRHQNMTTQRSKRTQDMSHATHTAGDQLNTNPEHQASMASKHQAVTLTQSQGGAPCPVAHKNFPKTVVDRAAMALHTPHNNVTNNTTTSLAVATGRSVPLSAACTTGGLQLTAAPTAA